MSFERPITLREVIDGLERDEYVLPAIQREFVWDADQIEKLFDSLMRGYPIGSFLFWKISVESLDLYQFYSFMDSYHERDNRHNKPIDISGRNVPVTAVLDGQQRLTAFNIALRGTFAPKLRYHPWSSDKAFPKRMLYLNLANELKDAGLKYEFRMLREKDKEEPSAEKFWFPVADILNFGDVGDAFDYCHDKGLTEGKRKFPYKTLQQLWRVVHEQRVVNYYLEKEQNLEKVLDIFIRLNSGGTPLSYSDMLLSIATAQWDEKDARQEIHSLVDDLSETGEGFDFTKDFVLKASLVLSDIPGIDFKVNNFNRENMLTIGRNWDRIAEALCLTARLLAGWGYNRQTLVSHNAAIPLAYYLYKRGCPPNFLSSRRFRDDRNQMRIWLSAALIKRVFSGQSDVPLRAFRRGMQHSADGFPLAEIVQELRDRKSMRFTSEDIEDLVTLRYNNRYTYCVLLLLYPWLRQENRFHVDHIFPRKLFNEAELSRRGIPADQWHLWLDRVDDIGNLQLLVDNPNFEKSGKELEEWLSAHFPNTDERKSYRQLNLIPNVDLSFENFPEFFEAREQLLAEKLAAALEPFFRPDAPTEEDDDGAEQVEKIRRVLARRPVSDGQAALYRALAEAGERGMKWRELAAAVDRTEAELSGVLGALGVRINRTQELRGERPGIGLFFRIRRRKDGWTYWIKAQLRQALEAEGLI